VVKFVPQVASKQEEIKWLKIAVDIFLELIL